jgi:hypothetical protein
MMSAPEGVGFVITPATTYVLFGDNLPRRIYTDGRNWPPSAMNFACSRCPYC